MKMMQLRLLTILVAAAAAGYCSAYNINTNNIRPLLKSSHLLGRSSTLSKLTTNHEASSLTTATKSTTTATTTRTDFLRNMFAASATLPMLALSSPRPSNAAPPFAIMAEELGYFPINDASGETVMVPAKARRSSSDQAVELAKYLQSTKAVMYGAFWCPHCQRQKELFGKEAWKYVTYVECSPKGYKSQYATCLSNGIDGYPSWKFGNGKVQSGEMELIDIAKTSGFSKKFSFDGSLEEGQVPSLGGGGCK